MANVVKVSFDTVVVPELRDRINRRQVQGGPDVAVPDKYFFGHSVTATIVVKDIQHCRLYWAEKTNIPIVREQGQNHFVDMHKLYPDADTFRPWMAAKVAHLSAQTIKDGQTIKIVDIPAMPGGTDKPTEMHRWLYILAIVYNATDQSCRMAGFRQDLLYCPGGGEASQVQRRFAVLNPLLANLAQSGDSVRNYAHMFTYNDVEMPNPVSGIAALFQGAPGDHWQ